jgi:hypothetical protein
MSTHIRITRSEFDKTIFHLHNGNDYLTTIEEHKLQNLFALNDMEMNVIENTDSRISLTLKVQGRLLDE